MQAVVIHGNHIDNIVIIVVPKCLTYYPKTFAKLLSQKGAGAIGFGILST